MASTNLITIWGVNIAGYEAGGWGNIKGSFKLYRSIATNYLKDDPNYIPDPTDPEDVAPQIVDVDKMFNEIALRFIKSLYSEYAQLRMIGFEPLHDHTKNYLRQAVYQAMQYGLENRDILERVSGQGVQTQSINVVNQPTGWAIPVDMFGTDAMQSIQMSNIVDYDVVDYDEAVVLTTQGNIQFIAKFDDSVIPELGLEELK